MPHRSLSTALIVSLFALALSGCGRAGSGSTGGGGGGGGSGGSGSGLSIALLQPSSIMVGVNQGYVYLTGQGITAASQVLVNGQPVSTVLEASGLLEGLLDTSVSATPGVYQFSVQDGSNVSNSLPFTVYTPQQGPFVMQAIPGFLVSENESNAPFIVAADTNGDGLSDVIMPAPALANSQSIAILRGQSNGTLSAAPSPGNTICARSRRRGWERHRRSGVNCQRQFLVHDCEYSVGRRSREFSAAFGATNFRWNLSWTGILS